jgi:hypothetical protein
VRGGAETCHQIPADGCSAFQTMFPYLSFPYRCLEKQAKKITEKLAKGDRGPAINQLRTDEGRKEGPGEGLGKEAPVGEWFDEYAAVVRI